MAIKEKEDKPAKRTLELELAAQVAAGLLAGPNTSHREPKEVARLAVAQARALIEAVDAENA